MATLDYYVSRFSRLKSDSVSGRWPETTMRRAPYKPLLLLSIIDQFAMGNVPDNLIEPTPDLLALYGIYCSLVITFGRKGSFALPFFHLKSEGFWHLIAKPGKESVLAGIQQVRSMARLDEYILGASLDEELYQLLQLSVARDRLRQVLIETYFGLDVQHVLWEQSSVNVESFHYSEQLLVKARMGSSVKEPLAEELYQPKARTQGFRRAVVIAYEQRCALCGIRVISADGHTAVDAAHIIPWSVSYNDDPRNGLALCRLCHWTFDEGLVTVSQSYLLLISPQLSRAANIPGHLATMANRNMVGPTESSFRPDQKSLDWHYHNIFRRH